MGLLNKKQTLMETEIFEQPEVLKGILEKEGIDKIEVPENVKKIIIVASGSSYHCARYTSEILGEIAEIEARSIYSSEFLLKKVIPHDRDTLYIFITQSGETMDTLLALRRVKEGFEDENGKYYLDTMSITNNPNSTVARETKYHFDCMAGEEKSIAATKSFTGQMACAVTLTLRLAKDKGLNVDEYINSLSELPEVVKQSLELRGKIQQLARLIAKQKVLAVLAEGISYAIGKEASLKIKETSYKHTISGIIGEFMHGHIAVLNEKKSAILFIAVSKMSTIASENLTKIKDEYNPSIYVIGRDNKYISNFNIGLDCKNDILQMFSNVVICQLLALENALKLGRDVDNPKGLKKVVK
ncbi:SIS domain-containing protein [bacterium]|nr:SIS domain-containing protein [bacterium]